MKPKLIIIFWPHAVGKMTVGQELSKITWLKLFHNHMSIDLVLQFFDYSHPSRLRLTNTLREEIFKEVISSDLKWIIYTYIRAFDIKEDWEYIEHICKLFEVWWRETYFIELEADLITRIDRNTTTNRLEYKPSKRNIKESYNNLLESIDKYRLNSYDWEITKKNYIKINNTSLTPEQVASQIKTNFKL